MMGPCGSHWQTDLPILTVVHVRQHGLLSCQQPSAHPLRCNACRWLRESSELCTAAAAAVLLKPSRLNSRHHATVLAFPCALAATTVGRS